LPEVIFPEDWDAVLGEQLPRQVTASNE